jgi:hypothetical protein
MNAISPGIWEQRIASGIKMIVNDAKNEIIVQIEGKNPIKYHCPEGVKLSDIERVQDQIETSFHVLGDPWQRYNGGNVTVAYNPATNELRVMDRGQVICIPESSRMIDFLIKAQTSGIINNLDQAKQNIINTQSKNQ